jgi:SAM-dependent methyltransferase
MELIAEAARRYGVQIEGRTVLDFGCGDGAHTREYARLGAREVIGVDIDVEAVRQAVAQANGTPAVRFHSCTDHAVPLGDASVDTAISYDVFEHVVDPTESLRELYRVLRPLGQALIGTWGWYHPYAPHLFAAMPVPWAHVLFSERTILRVCRRVYEAAWYEPTSHDLDETGRRKPDKYLQDEIPSDYVNKVSLRGFRRALAASGFRWRMHLVPFGSRYARWSRLLVHVPWLREFFTGYVWIVLTRPGGAAVEADRPRKRVLVDAEAPLCEPARTL